MKWDSLAYGSIHLVSFEHEREFNFAVLNKDSIQLLSFDQVCGNGEQELKEGADSILHGVDSINST